jgi:lysozyme family protein
MTDLVALKAANAKRWAVVKLTRNYTSIARALISPIAKARYVAVSKRTGVPWFIIAVIHEREASQNWRTQLGQGDPLDHISVHVPKGRGPFVTWEDGAYDALVNCAPHASRWTDWSAGGALTLLEQYNGLGYSNMGKPSPYVWSGTDQYKSGKYVLDGKYDPTAIDSQPGCANLLLTMAQLDPTITFTGLKVIPPSAPAPKPVPAPAPQPGFWASIINAILSIFKRK